ncbi:MAG: hypothetical protein HFF39_03030 [Lawsonibacter sp.]|nr:hypothetical protein [Lawsonibacter sp.]
MKKLFTMIRRGNLEEVAAILDKKPDLISCLAKAPPKKDDGQSPLMVAIKSDNLEAAHLLLDRGADVNFADAVNPYGINFSAPIWYDAVGQCFMRAGDHVSQADKGLFPSPAPPAGHGDGPQPENLPRPHGLAARTGAV